jgi:small subunit ribosomal protein S20
MEEQKEEKKAKPKSPSAKAEQTTEKKAKTRRPSAEKRAKQSEKNRLRNRSYQSKVATAVRSFRESLEKAEGKELSQEQYNKVCSLMDTGVKKGMFTKNKAARIKSRNAKKLSKKS